MITAPDVADLDSTLIRRGVNAATFTDMAEFVETIERRPLDKLLHELPALATLSEMKFSLARQVIRRRARALTEIDREQLRVLACELADQTNAQVGERIRGIFALA
ncbi:MAG TPA: hypothetical protein VHW00_17405 [Thermoanaerobaculia bacterium]|nr:hypothetical protein [Thermoanaerobaculia bacterium]